MAPEVTAAIITTGGLVLVSLGAFVGRLRFFDNLFNGGRMLNLLGNWESTWKDCDPDGDSGTEFLVIERQRGARVWGYIYMDTEAEKDKRWSFEGNFNGRFFQLMYFPSDKADNKLFLDYGCYFFELKGNGSFAGYSIGYQWNNDKAGPSTHQLRRVGPA